jgi:pimeloyl-ACP methyl ester carboxylesterase
VWQAWAEHADRQRLPMIGRLVNVEGRRVHVIEMGADQPGPVVVLECGIGGATAASWGQIEPAVARFAHVIAYDRAGMGLSDPAPGSRDGIALTRELHLLLDTLGIRPPVVLVGHSYGGLLARVYTGRWPAQVAGLVLAESSHPDQFGRAAVSRRRFTRAGHFLPVLPFAARTGMVRAVLAFIPTSIRTLPPPARDRQLAFMAASRQWDTIVAELDAWDTTNVEMRAIDGDLGDRPLEVLTAGGSARAWGRWGSFQQQTARLSRRGHAEVVPGAQHATLIEDPRYAPAVVAAIRRVVEELRAPGGASGRE